MSAEPPATVPEMWQTFPVRFEYYGKQYDTAVTEGANMSYWERMAREHDARQPFIEEEIIAILQACPVTSYRDVATRINGWCSGMFDSYYFLNLHFPSYFIIPTAASIERWLKTHPSYCIYAKNIKPGLSPENK